MSELGQRLVRARPADAGAGEHDRPLGVAEQPHRFLRQIGIAQRFRRRSIVRRRLDIRRRHVELHVERDVEEGGPHAAAGGVPQRGGDEVPQPAGVVAGPGPLRDRGDQRDLVHLLQRAHLELEDRILPGQDQDGRVRVGSIGDPGDGIGHSRSSSDGGHAGLKRDPCPSVGRVRCGLLVAKVDDADPLIDASVVDRGDVAT